MNDIEHVKNIISNFIIDRADTYNLKKWFGINTNTVDEIKSIIKTEKIELLYNNYDQISKKNGIYFVVTLKNIIKDDINDTVKLDNEKKYSGNLYELSKLIEKYDNIKNTEYKNILYIGKAEEKNGLKGRIKKYIKFGYGECSNHAGGRTIWQLKNNRQFYIAWIECSSTDKNISHKAESYFIENYKKCNLNKIKYMNYPFANWRK